MRPKDDDRQDQDNPPPPPLEENPPDNAQPNGAETRSSGLPSNNAPGIATNDPPATHTALLEPNNDVLAANVGDQPSPNDSLGFTPYVEAIAAFLTNDVTKPPLTLSIEGEWGSGKSSFMLQLKERLRGKMSIVDFNAWRYDKDDAMWAAFALEFARKLAGELPFYYRWWAHVKLFFKRFQWERGWIDMVRLLVVLTAVLIILLLPILMWDKILTFVTSAESFSSILGKALGRIVWGGGILGYAGLIVLLGVKLKNTFGNPLKINLKQYLDTPDYKSRVAFIERFHQDFGNVARTYGRGEKICVFIDDLDRCEVPKAADLMQALNLMITDDKDSKLIFIMGMDREKVAAGLAVKYEKLLPYLAPAPAGTSSKNATFDPVRGLEYGYGFIEKFIQLPFHIPQASDTQVEEFVKKLLSSNDSTPSVIETSSRSQSTAAGKSAEKAVTENSEMVTEILKMVAPTLDYNPRRLKQFINAFRLKTFIASKLHLFPQATESDKPDGLTIQQIGKFVAISLHWPLLLADLDNERDLLSRLQGLVLDNISVGKLITKVDGEDRLVAAPISTNQGSIKVTPALYRWYARDDLRQLLRVKLINELGEVDHEARRIYSLEQLDVNKLLQVSLIPAKTNEGPSMKDPILTSPPQHSAAA